jgi:GNAT superfamily N-acetyltransferase
VDIVAAQRNHIPEIVNLWKELMDFHKQIDPFYERDEGGHQSFEKFVGYLIESAESLVLVAVDDDTVFAYSIAQIKSHPPVFRYARHGIILDMMVQEGRSREGIGEKILSKMLSWFTEREIERVELHVAARNSVGRSFWKKHGFTAYEHILCREIQ